MVMDISEVYVWPPPYAQPNGPLPQTCLPEGAARPAGRRGGRDGGEADTLEGSRRSWRGSKKTLQTGKTNGMHSSPPPPLGTQPAVLAANISLTESRGSSSQLGHNQGV